MIAVEGAQLDGMICLSSCDKTPPAWSAAFHVTRITATAPKSLVFSEMTTKIALGAVVMRIPAVTELDRDPLQLIETGDWVAVDGDRGIIEIHRRSAQGPTCT